MFTDDGERLQPARGDPDGQCRVYTINLPTGTYTLTQTGAGEDGNLTGDLDITRDMTIAGAGATATIINGNNVDRVLDIRAGNVTISGVTIRGGKAPNGPAGSISPAGPGGAGENGGGIRNTFSLTLTNCIVTANHAGAGGTGATDLTLGTAFPGGAGGAGGGIYNTGTLRTTDTLVSSNDAGNGGAGASGSGITIVSAGAAGGNGGDGGGIYNSGTLIVTGTTLQSNNAGSAGNGGNGGSAIAALSPGGAGGNGGHGGNGGGVYNGGNLTLARTTSVGNVTGNGGEGGLGGGGGMGIVGPGMPGASGGTGGAGGNGSAIFNGGKSTITNSTVSGNTAGNGAAGASGGSGGMAFPGPYTGGTGGVGGNGGNGGSGGIYSGIFATATITVSSATITANLSGTRGAAGSGGPGGFGSPSGSSGSAGNDGIVGTGGGVAPYSGTLTLKHTILANNTTPAGGQGPDCFGLLASQGYNLIRTLTNCTVGGTTTGNITGQDPKLNALADNGGGTLTHALQSTSPARDAGDPTGCKDAGGTLLLVDQRGKARTVGVSCDMGAFEWQVNLFLPLLRR
jgi:hypothetical protein